MLGYVGNIFNTKQQCTTQSGVLNIWGCALIVELSVGMARDKGGREGGEGQMVCLLWTFLKIWKSNFKSRFICHSLLLCEESSYKHKFEPFFCFFWWVELDPIQVKIWNCQGLIKLEYMDRFQLRTQIQR